MLYLLYGLQGIKEADAPLVDDDQLLNGPGDFFDNMGGYNDDPRVFLNAFLQQLVKLHPHNGVKAENRLVQQDNLPAACQADDGGDHGFHAKRELAEFLFAVQFKTFHHFQGEVVIKVGIYLRCGLQKPVHREIKMLREVFNVADARIQSRCGDGPAVNLDNAFCDVLISGDGLEQGGFACSVSAQQTVDPRFIDGQRDAA